MMESKYDLVQFGPEDLDEIRQKYNMDTEEKREEAFRILEEWLLKQDHLIKKTYSKDYLERCIWSCNGSIEKAKLQIDRICTMRTLFPKYFQTSNLKESNIMEWFEKCYVGFSSRLTKQSYRVFTLKVKHNIYVSSEDLENLYKFLILAAEYLKSRDVSNRYIFVFDLSQANLASIVKNFNIFELQQVFSIYTAGFGGKIQGIIFVTTSKLIERLVYIVKSVLKEKLRKRIHVAATRDRLKDFLLDDIEVLPVEYGGKEKPLEELHDHALATLSSESAQESLMEMNQARTDETKRQTDKFNDKYMGMAGTFRTISLD